MQVGPPVLQPRERAWAMNAGYLEDAFQDLKREDGLLVMAKGLGIQRIVARFLRMYAETPGALVVCLRLSSPEDHQLLQDALLADGMEPSLLPRVVTNELTGTQREALYKQGGCYLITSRILIVDLLGGRLAARSITGMIVNQADKVTEASTEAFIVRKYRQSNRKGFLKAFSDEPEPLLRGFAKVERVLKHLYLKRLYIWPRFHAAVKDCLSKNQPEVIELAQSLTPAMKAIQQAILVAMDQCLTELKRITNLDVSELTLENGIFKAFDSLVRSQLNPEWHRISAKTKQVVQDLKILRSLLDYLLRYDAITFYTFLISIQRASSQQRYPSQWLHSEAANRLFQHAKSRIYRVLPAKTAANKPANSPKGAAAADGDSASTSGGSTGEGAAKQQSSSSSSSSLRLQVVLEENPKWRLLREVLQEARAAVEKEQGAAGQAVGGARVLVLVRDDHTCSQLTEYLRVGGPAMMQRRFTQHLSTKLAMDGGAKGAGRAKRGRGGGKFMSSGREALADAERELLLAEFVRVKGPPVAEKQKRRKKGSAEKEGGEDGEAVKEAEGSEDEEEEEEEGEEGGKGKAQSQKGRGKGKKRKRPEREEEVGPNQALQRVEEIFQEILGSQNGAPIWPTGQAAVAAPGDRGAGSRRLAEVVCEPLDPMHVVFYTYAQAYQKMSLLDELLPQAIVLYDPDTQFVREIEVHQTTRGLGEASRIRVYFIVYEDSVEEQRYLTTLKREKESFERLIHEKKHMVLPAEVFEVRTSEENFAIMVADSRARMKNPPKTQCTKVVVDVREFRSSLPNLLDLAGLSLHPATLEIGDFILTPEIAVERKSVSDLFGSFASGRLYTQVETMLRFYKVPTLLIEFQPDKAFALQTLGEISGDIQLANIISKLVLLTLKFTELRLLWSRSSYATVDLFKDLKQGNAAVDVQKALTAGGGSTDEEEQLGRNVAAEEVLLRLPGVTPGNYRLIMRKVESLAKLSSMSVEELHEVMESEGHAKLLHAFFHQDTSTATAMPATAASSSSGGAGGGRGFNKKR